MIRSEQPARRPPRSAQTVPTSLPRMSVDVRTRSVKDVRSLERDEMFDAVLPEALAVHGDLAGRGCSYLGLSSLGFDVDGRTITLTAASGTLRLVSDIDAADVVAHLASDALSDLLQDRQSTMGLAMTSRVKISAGDITDWISWEPVLRALLDGRKVHEAGDVTHGRRRRQRARSRPRLHGG